MTEEQQKQVLEWLNTPLTSPALAEKIDEIAGKQLMEAPEYHWHLVEKGMTYNDPMWKVRRLLAIKNRIEESIVELTLNLAKSAQK